MFNYTFEILNNSNCVIAAQTEHFETDDSETSKRIERTNNKYFNAGVTFINYDKRVEHNFNENLS